ncbi:Uncharacterised protein [Mycobacteroides abscessus]|nr:Uncharacterised protein [Mycobacteroides abscessus]
MGFTGAGARVGRRRCGLRPVWVIPSRSSTAPGVRCVASTSHPDVVRDAADQAASRSATACCSTWTNTAGSCAPETPYRPSTTKNGTPLIP